MLDQATPTLSYVWRSPGKSRTIALNLAVVDRLGLAVQEGCQAALRRAPEVGGILLGRVRWSNGETTVEIEDFEFVESEHAVGPSYLLSAADRQAVESRIRQYRKASHKWSVVGLFRSHTRRDFAITTEDACLMSESFTESSRVFLLIHAIADEPLKGGYAIWDGRNMRVGKPYEEFPFSSAALMSGNYDLSQLALSTPGARPKWPGVAMPSLTSVASPLVAVLSLLRCPTWLRALKSSDFPVVRFSPRLRGGLSRWIRQSVMRFSGTPPKQKVLQWIAAVAVLLAAIAAGLYHGPARPAALIWQTVPTNAGAGIPSALPSIPEAPPAAILETAIPTVPAPAAVEEKPLPMPPPSELPVAVAAPVAAAAPSAAKPVSRDSLLTGSRSQFVGPTPVKAVDLGKLSAPVRVPTIPLLPDAPEVTNALAGNVDFSREPEVARFEAPRIPDPLVTVSVETLPGSRRLPGKHRSGTRDQQAQYGPPTLVREAAMTIPTELRQSIRQLIAINVKLYLDRSGKVEFSELLSNGTGSNRELASMAVFSSRHCEFSPAHLGDETVPAEVVLRYRFAPETKHD
jgi:hypothetical protein